MSKVKVKFTGSGRYGDEPSKPIFDVEDGDIRELTPRLANLIVSAGKGQYYVEPRAEEPKARRKPGPKPKSEKGPEPKAEGLEFGGKSES